MGELEHINGPRPRSWPIMVAPITLAFRSEAEPDIEWYEVTFRNAAAVKMNVNPVDVKYRSCTLRPIPWPQQFRKLFNPCS